MLRPRAEADADADAGQPPFDDRRLFVAVPLAEEVNSVVRRLVDDVRRDEPPGRGVRWVRLDGLHVTLRFLGPTSTDRIEPIAAAVRRTAIGSEPFATAVAGAGAFPSSGRPRTLWLGIDDTGDAMAGLARRLDDELQGLGWERQDRPFRPHLTLARADGVRAGPASAAALRAAAEGLRLESPVDRIVLFESLTGGGPARYVPLHEERLGAG
jgi:2'-5' RNA ligase